jgi:hypothetical protein
MANIAANALLARINVRRLILSRDDDAMEW